MKILFAVTWAALAALTCADVSHLGGYNYPVPESKDFDSFTPKHISGQPDFRAHIESIKSSVPLRSFQIRQNIGSQGDASTYSYNAAQQQHFPASVYQQSYTGPAATSVQQKFSAPAQSFYLSAAPQQYHSALTVQQPSFSSLTPTFLKESFQAPAITAAQNTFSSSVSAPVFQQLYPAPAASQQSFSAHSIAPIQQTYSSPAVQQQNHLSAGQIREQSLEFSGNQQQSYGGIDSTSVEGNGAYSYQPPVQQQSFSTAVTAPLRQSFTADTIQQTYSGPGAAPVQDSFSTPATGKLQQAVTDFYHYKPLSQEQLPYTRPIQQAIPVQLAGLAGIAGVNTGSFGYETPTSVLATSPVSILGGVEYPVSAPQKISSLAPVPELKASSSNPETDTVYGQNGGYVYHKL